MKAHQILWSAFLIATFLPCTSNKIITFLPLDQNEFKTMCDNGTLINDTITFKSHIALNRYDLFDNMTYVNYAVNEFDGKKNPTDPFAKLVNIECEKTSDKIECRKSEDSMIFLYQVLAKEKYFKANMTVYLSKRLNRYETDIQAFPQIYDPRNASGNVTINGVHIPNDNCKTNIRSYNLNLTFVCSSPAKPCKIEITTNDSTTATFNESAVFERFLQNQTALEIVINYAACRLDGQVNSIRCIVTVDLTSTTENDDLNICIIIISVIVAIIVAAVIIVLVLIAKGKIPVKCTKAGNRKFAGCSCCEAELGQAHEKIKLKDILQKDNLWDKIKMSKIMSVPPTINHKKVEKAAMLNNVKNITRPYANDYPKKEKDLRKRQTHELNISKDGDEDELTTIECKKNSGHKDFIRLADFKIEHLGVNGDKDTLNLIKNIAELTVLVTFNRKVKAKKAARKVSHPNENETLQYTATGMIVHAVEIKASENKKCQCPHCKESPVKHFVNVTMVTHEGVVNCEILPSIKCTFYKKSLTSKSKEVTVGGWRVIEMGKELLGDNCLLTCDSHDPFLIQQVCTDFEKLIKQMRTISEKRTPCINKMVFIVSHPHGCEKHVSVGNECYISEDECGKSRYYYNACTCPGSSGAYVCFLGEIDRWLKSQYFHCGTSDNAINYSSVNFELQNVKSLVAEAESYFFKN